MTDAQVATAPDGSRLEYVVQLRATDVLFGRGSGPNDHEGNVTFRSRVAERKAEYMATNHRMTKAKIARDIVNSVLQENGRFLKKVEQPEIEKYGLPAGIDAWMEVDDDTIMEKAKQALRQNSAKNKAAKAEEAAAVAAGVHSTHQPQLSQQRLQQANEVFLNMGDLEPLPLRTKPPSVPSTNPALQQYASAQMGQNSMGPPASMPWTNDMNYRNPQQTASSLSSNAYPNYVQASKPHDLPSDNMLSYVQGRGKMDPNESFADISISEFDPRRESISINDLRNVELMRSSNNHRSLDMDDLMDSFSRSKISTEGSEQRKMLASSETMGTIENLASESIADMSFGTMNSSTLSFAKGPDAMQQSTTGFSYGSGNSGQVHMQPHHPGAVITSAPVNFTPGMPLRGSELMSSLGTTSTYDRRTSDTSISIHDFWSSRRKSSSIAMGLQGVVEEGEGQYTNAGGRNDGISTGSMVMESMGASSVAMLKGMLLNSELELPEDGPPDAVNHPRQNSG